MFGLLEPLMIQLDGLRVNQKQVWDSKSPDWMSISCTYTHRGLPYKSGNDLYKESWNRFGVRSNCIFAHLPACLAHSQVELSVDRLLSSWLRAILRMEIISAPGFCCHPSRTLPIFCILLIGNAVLHQTCSICLPLQYPWSLPSIGPISYWKLIEHKTPQVQLIFSFNS